uniref:Uncharacterized protein n=1 Tax=Anguilla anguilla TaxID=7936 RepID=A0A0E9V0V0_ANGAN
MSHGILLLGPHRSQLVTRTALPALRCPGDHAEV